MHRACLTPAVIVPVILAVLAGCVRSREETTTSAMANRTHGATSVSMMKGLLDGRRFAGSYIENGQRVTDTIAFADGHFRSYGCDMYGFDHPDYTATQNGDEIIFSAEAASAREGTMRWTGKVTGKALSGKYIWVKEGQNPSEREFTAKEL